jgi:hypothetical protein
MRDRLTLFEAFTIGLYLVVFGILGMARKIQNKLRAVRKGTDKTLGSSETYEAGGSTMRGSDQRLRREI